MLLGLTPSHMCDQIARLSDALHACRCRYKSRRTLQAAAYDCDHELFHRTDDVTTLQADRM
jgi:hypothetical protein